MVNTIDIFLEYIKSYYERQFHLFGDYDNKASTVMNISLLFGGLEIAALTYLYQMSEISFRGKSEAQILLLVAISFLLVLLSVIFSLIVQYPRNVKDIPSPETALDLYVNKYKEADESRVKEVIGVAYSDASNQYLSINQNKARLIYISYILLFSSILLILPVVFILFFLTRIN